MVSVKTKAVTKPIVLSASRMTDMPAFYPNELISEVERRIRLGQNIHTLVLWTKHPQSLLRNPLLNYLIELKKRNIQLFIQLTISGLGHLDVFPNVKIEPNVPDFENALATLPKVLELIESPLRILLRIDPIIRIQNSSRIIFSNIDRFEAILSHCAKLGIRNFTFSFLEKGMHAKVDRRFEQHGLSIESPSSDERMKMMLWVTQLKEKYNVDIQSCCVPGLEGSSCINGLLLERLHDSDCELSHKQTHSRLRCGCTHSVDIGGWPPKSCPSGCLYCYSRPVISEFGRAI